MYCTVSYCSEGLPSAHVASLVALGPCTVLYCTLLYFTTVLYCTLLLSLPPHPMLHLNIKSRENPCCGFSVMVDFIWMTRRRTNGRTDGGLSKIRIGFYISKSPWTFWSWNDISSSKDERGEAFRVVRTDRRTNGQFGGVSKIWIRF